MAAYKDLVGQKITKVTSNPPEPKTGQMWYNSTSGSLRGLGISEAWASAPPMAGVRYRHTAFGTATAGVITGGSVNTPGAQPSTTNTEEYNGSGFSSGGALGTARRGLASAGIITAGLVFGGSGGSSDANVNNESEEYNGTSFSEGNNLNTSRSAICGDGSQTAAFAAIGYIGPQVANSSAF